MLNGGKIPGTENYIIHTSGNIAIHAENEDELIIHRVFFEGKANRFIFVADAKNLKRSLALYLGYNEFEMAKTTLISTLII